MVKRNLGIFGAVTRGVLKGWLLLSLALMVGTAQSEDRTPSPTKSAEGSKTSAANGERKAGEDQRGTEKQPLVVKGMLIVKTDTEAREEREYRESQTSIGTSISKALKGLENETEKTTSLTLLLFGVAAIQAGLFLWQLILIRNSSRDTKDLAEAARLQSRALVAEKLPIVLWKEFKLVAFDALDQPVLDPVPPGPVPAISRPVFVFQNTGPTKIVTLYYAMKWEVTNDLKKEPHFDGMMYDGMLLKADQMRAFTTNIPIKFTEEQRQNVESGHAQLWVYGFVYYNDFMDEGHRLGSIAKWDPARGFVQVVRENYSYHRHEKSYTKHYPEGGGGQPIRV